MTHHRIIRILITGLICPIYFLESTMHLSLTYGNDASPRKLNKSLEHRFPALERLKIFRIDIIRGGGTTKSEAADSKLPETTLGIQKRRRGRPKALPDPETEKNQRKKLDMLLQRAAAYSAFLRERLLQSQADADQAKKIHGCIPSLTNNSKVDGAALDPRQPRLLTGGVMRSYQIDGLQWLISLYENGLNGILADEMGLGKTIQVIAFLAHLWEMKVQGPFLIVAPLSTVGSWIAELNRFAPSLPVLLYHGKQEERAVLRRTRLRPPTSGGGPSGGFPVVVSSYDVIRHDARYLSRLVWKYLAVDEGHRLKNRDSLLLQELRRLPTANRLLMTGTPLQNNLDELWTLLNFILPDIFNDLKAFQNWFNFEDILGKVGGGAAKILRQEAETRVVSKLHAILDPFLLRRLKSDVAAPSTAASLPKASRQALELPAKHVYVVYANLSPLQLQYYRAAANDTLHELVDSQPDSAPPDPDAPTHADPAAAGRPRPRDGMRDDDEESDDQGGEAGVEKGTANLNPECSLEHPPIQLRKCCNHPYMFRGPVDGKGRLVLDERLVESSGKMQILDRMLRILHAGGHKVLIFFQMTRMLDIVQAYMEKLRGWRCCRIDGTVPLEDRQARILDFANDPAIFCFLLTTRAGGTGISLPAADTVIIYETDYNPQQDLQAQDRCHRIGQTKAVGVYRLMVRGSVEEDVLRRAVCKRKLELMTINRKMFKVAEKLSGSTNLREVLSGVKGTELRSAFSAAELETLLESSGGAAPAGAVLGEGPIISDQDLARLLLERGGMAPTAGGPGWEVMVEATSSFA